MDVTAGTGAPIRVAPVAAEATYGLRQRVLRPHQDPSEVGFPGDSQPAALHLAARGPGGEIVGTASLVPEAAPEAVAEAAVTASPGGRPAFRLRGMATDEGWRSQGVGSRVLAAVIDHVAGAGGGLVWCNARLPARRFYERHGFAAHGEPWDDPAIGPHVVMWRLVEAAEV